MRTIAERLNLSVATVSRALRRVPGINPETRARSTNRRPGGLPVAEDLPTVADNVTLPPYGVIVLAPERG